jgi:N,N'-diacetyllegionaminate synthase
MQKIIAEIGSVHDGKIELALKLIKKAAQSGADIIKFQMHLPEFETFKNAPRPSYFMNEDRFDYFKRTSFTLNQWKKIKNFCESCNVEFMCSPFSVEAVNLLEKLKVKSYKVPSGELTNFHMLKRLNKTKKKILISTGMSNFKDINNALKHFNTNKVVLLQCSSIYPCPLNEVGLNVLEEFKKRFKCEIGFSDHTKGFEASFSAAALGANIIEKHFTISRKMYGSDAKNSMEPKDFKFFTSIIKNIWFIKNNPVDKNNLKKYKNTKVIFEKSIYAKKNIKKGTNVNINHLSFKKPNKFLRADKYNFLLNKKLLRNINQNEPILLSDVK